MMSINENKATDERTSPVIFHAQEPRLTRQKTAKDESTQTSIIESDIYWETCCCGKTDHRIITFIVQIFFGFMLCFFCLYKLSLSLSCAEENVYISLLSGIVGIFLPSPRIMK